MIIHCGNIEGAVHTGICCVERLARAPRTHRGRTASRNHLAQSVAIASSRGGLFEGGAVGPATTTEGAGLSNTPWHRFGYNRPVIVRPLAEPGMVQYDAYPVRCKKN